MTVTAKLTPDDLARLTEEERELHDGATHRFESSVRVSDKAVAENVLLLLTRLAQARAVVEAARKDVATHYPGCQCLVHQALAAHDAKVGG